MTPPEGTAGAFATATRMGGSEIDTAIQAARQTSVQQLGRNHVGYGVVPEHYDTVGAALVWTLEQGLGEAFTPEVKEAWIAVYTLLASVMKDATAKV